MNHAIKNHGQYFDPKIDDTLVLNEHIRDACSNQFPGLQRKNILGSWFGLKVENPESSCGTDTVDLTRSMRGETSGMAYLYETDYVLPSGIDGYKYWDALDELRSKKNIEHIVIVFPQIFTKSSLDIVEVPNQVAKEIGYKTWLYWNEKDYGTYPQDGHPFADHWGVWAYTECYVDPDNPLSGKEPCCFEMGGCTGTDQPYPPERQSPMCRPISVLDPSLVFDIPAYGHLGYDPMQEPPPSLDAPVQEQYRGTWVMWEPPNDNPKAGTYIAKKVFEHIMKYSE